MATVSLIDTGVQLGRTSGQEVKLGSLRSNGYSRDHATDGYLAVNPYEVEGGNAQDPDEAGTEHRLGDWLNYDHNRLPAGSDVEDLQGGYDTVDIAWSAPAGASRAPEITGFRIYIKDTGAAHTTPPTETETSTDPTSAPDATEDVGEGASVIEALEKSFPSGAGNWVAVAVVTIFNDSVTTHEDSAGASAKAGEEALTGAFEGILVKVFASNPGPISATQTTDPDTCSTPDPVNIRIDCNMEGASTGTLQRSVNGGAFATVDSNVAAGTSTINRSETSGNNYRYRLRYNDVSPDEWATSNTESATCNLA